MGQECVTLFSFYKDTVYKDVRLRYGHIAGCVNPHIPNLAANLEESVNFFLQGWF